FRSIRPAAGFLVGRRERRQPAVLQRYRPIVWRALGRGVLGRRTFVESGAARDRQRGTRSCRTFTSDADVPALLLEQLLDPRKERAGVGAVDRAVIERLREDADRTNRDRIAF